MNSSPDRRSSRTYFWVAGPLALVAAIALGGTALATAGDGDDTRSSSPAPRNTVVNPTTATPSETAEAPIATPSSTATPPASPSSPTPTSPSATKPASTPSKAPATGAPHTSMPSTKTPSTTTPTTKAPETTKAKAPSVDVDALRSALITETNRVRVANGRTALKSATCLSGTAKSWAASLDSSNQTQHSSLQNVLDTCDYTYTAENLALVSRSYTAKQIVAMWMGSGAHRENLLSEKATLVGLGVRYDKSRNAIVVVEQFGRP